MSDTSLSLNERLEARIERIPDAGCWLWTAARSTAGYGQLRYAGEITYAHRLSYQEYIGEIPVGLFVLHRCDVRCCINPSHLFLGTNKDNMDDKIRKGRQIRGEQCTFSKLSETDIVNIRKRSAGGDSVFDISEDYPVHIRHIYAVIRREWWKHVRS